MEICGIICEFNPFHNGHKYLLERAREITRCDYLICVMSGNFTQRGEICVLDKYTRAKHAILGGADCVLELPAAFSVAPAEIFARGAVKLLAAVPHLNSIAFGSENADKDGILSVSALSVAENEQFKSVLSENLARGESYAKSYFLAFGQVFGNAELIRKPNNILAIEYTKAIKTLNANIDIFPIKRVGAGYNDGILRENFSSASAIRKNLSSPLIQSNLPQFVAEDLQSVENIEINFQNAVKLILSRTAPETLKRIYGCGEGLENALKAVENKSYGEIISKCTNKRYPASRIRRLLTANFLKLYADDCRQYFSENLYFTPLAVKKSVANEVLGELSRSIYPVITSGGDVRNLSGAAKKCKTADEFAHAQWQQIAGKKVSEKLIVV